MAGGLEIGVWSLLIAASITDILWGKIFNALTFSFILLGIAARFFSFGPNELIQSLLAVGIAFLLYFPLYYSKVMAAGDVKLLMAAGAWLSLNSLLQLAGVTILIGAIVGVLLMVGRQGGLGALKNLANHLQNKAEKKSTRIPFAPAFLCAFSFLKIAEMRGWTL